jgi:ribose-phosphate pyrophosphokinase
VFAACTHPVLSGKAIERINDSNLSKLIVTDTLPLTTATQKIEVDSVAHIFAEAMKRTFKHMSISSLFDIDKG